MMTLRLEQSGCKDNQTRAEHQATKPQHTVILQTAHPEVMAEISELTLDKLFRHIVQRTDKDTS